VTGVGFGVESSALEQQLLADASHLGVHQRGLALDVGNLNVGLDCEMSGFDVSYIGSANTF
jgi:hypothetical protein